MAKFIILCSMSAAGKDSIQNKLLKELSYLKQIISSTSRPKRQGEPDNTYNFISKDEMLSLIYDEQMIEYREYYVANGDTWYYGIAKDSIDKYSDNVYITILDVKGLQQLINYVGKENVFSFYIKASDKTRLLRSLNRERNMTDNKVEEVVRRYIADKRDFNYVESYVDHCLINETEHDFKNCIEVLKVFIENLKEKG